MNECNYVYYMYSFKTSAKEYAALDASVLLRLHRCNIAALPRLDVASASETSASASAASCFRDDLGMAQEKAGGRF